MANVVDSLVLEFGLDPSKFTKGQREAIEALRQMKDESKRYGADIEQQGLKVNEVFGHLKREVVSILGVFLAGRGIKEFTGYVTTLDAATDRTAKTVNMATEELSAWQSAMEQNGGTAASITGTIAGLSGEMNRFALTGQASFLPILNQMGISLYDGNHNLKTSAELMLEISDAVKSIDPARATAMLNMIPGMNPDTVNLLIQGRAAVEGYLDAARRAGGATDESAAAAKRYQQELAILDRTATNTGRNIMTFFMPAIVTALTKVGEFFDALNHPPKTPEEAEARIAGTRQGMIKKFGDPRDVLNAYSDAWNDSILASVFGRSAKMGDYYYGHAGASGAASGGIRSKPGAGQASLATALLAKDLQASVPGLDRFTAFNDIYHQLLGRSSAHQRGEALDFTIKDVAKSAAVAAQVRGKLLAMGIDAKVIDEYANPSHGSTGGHIHVQFASAGAASAYASRYSRYGAGAAGTVNNRGGDTSHSVHVENVNVYTNAKDAKGMVQDMNSAMKWLNFASSANYGNK